MSRSYPHICLLWKGSHCDDKKMVHHCWIRIFIKTGCPFYTVEYEASKIWCSSFRGHYICIVAVQQNQSANFIKVGNSWKISFYKLPLYFCNTIVNSIISTTTVYLVLPNISRIFELLLRIQGIYAPLGTNITWLSTRSLFILNSYSISHSSKHTRCSAFQETFELHLLDQVFIDLLSTLLICNQILKNRSCLCMKQLKPLVTTV